MAINLGADILGLVGHMPSGPGIISDDTAASIVNMVPKGVETFLLTSETTAAGVIAHHKRVNSSAIQLVDELSKADHAIIAEALPGIKLVQVIHVMDDTSIKQAQDMAAGVDALLLDSGNPNLKTKELGGTGRIHNWSLSQQIVDSVEVPVYLAGGLAVSNVKQAVSQVRPHGIDLCSSVRSNDHLDLNKLAEFMSLANDL